MGAADEFEVRRPHSHIRVFSLAVVLAMLQSGIANRWARPPMESAARTVQFLKGNDLALQIQTSPKQRSKNPTLVQVQFLEERAVSTLRIPNELVVRNDLCIDI